MTLMEFHAALSALSVSSEDGLRWIPCCALQDRLGWPDNGEFWDVLDSWVELGVAECADCIRWASSPPEPGAPAG